MAADNELVSMLKDSVVDRGSKGSLAAANRRMSQSSSAPQLGAASPGAAASFNASRGGSKQVWIDMAAVDEEPLSPLGAGTLSPTSVADPRTPLSRPSSRTGGSTSSSRPSSRRFTQDELNCFRRVVTPSPSCEAKLQEAFFQQSSSSMRRAASDHGLSQLPVLKGKFFASTREMSSPVAAEKARARRQKRELLAACHLGDERLPKEELTSAILDEIYPRVPPNCKGTSELHREHAPDQGTPPSGETLEHAMTHSPSMRPGTSGSRVTSGHGGLMMEHVQSLRPGTSGSRHGTLVGHAPSIKKPSGNRVRAQTSIKSTAPPQESNGGSSTTTRRSLFHSSKGAEEELPIMLRFRHRLLERFASVKEAHDCFSDDVPPDRGMSRKEWRRVLAKQGFDWPTKEKDLLFEELDWHGTGHITLSDFHIAVEAASPVRSVEDLRRRWLASGYHTMNSAIRTMVEAGITIQQRLTFEDFASALCRVSVTDPAEHSSIYQAICSDCVTGKVSLGELLSAIATVSPALLIEDIRHRLNRFFNGDWDKAFFELDMDHGGTIELHEFVAQANKRLGLSADEAKKAFRQIDTDGSGEISKEEFVCAITLAEPSLFLEDLRLKIRRCFRSIQDSFWKAFADNLTGELGDSPPKMRLARFQDILMRLDLKEHETQMLFELIDTSHDGELTIHEFVRGVHHFAPSVALEDLRMRCVQRDHHVANTFAHIVDKTKFMKLQDFAEVLGKMELLDEKEVARSSKSSHGRQMVSIKGGVCVPTLFDLLDVTHTGLATLGRLVAALQSCGAGSHVRLSTFERDQKSLRDMKDHLWPKRRLIHELKTQVRLGVNYVEEKAPEDGQDEEKPPDKIEMPTTRHLASDGTASRVSPTMQGNLEVGLKKQARPSSRSAGGPGAENRSDSPGPLDASAAHNEGGPEKGGATTSGPPPRLRTVPHEELATYMDAENYQNLRKGPGAQKASHHRAQNAQDCFGCMWKSLKDVPAADSDGRKKLESSLHRYFQSAALSMSHDVPLVSGLSHHSMERYRKIKQHKAALHIP